MVDRERFAGKAILVADDDLSLRVLLSAVFKRLGADVALAANGEEAIEHLAQPPDLLVLDLFMPTVSGFEVLEHLRVHDPTLLARTVIITGGTRRVDALLGDLAVLHKPFDLNRFIEMLERCLDASPRTLAPLHDWQARLHRKTTRSRSTRQATGPTTDNHRFTSETARIAGRKGGEAVSRDRARTWQHSVARRAGKS